MLLVDAQDSALWRYSFVVESLQRPRLRRLKPQVQIQQRPTLLRPLGEILLAVHPRKIAPQVNLVTLSVRRTVQHGVGVGEDVLVSDVVVVVVLAEPPQPQFGDVAHTIPVPRVAVERQALSSEVQRKSATTTDYDPTETATGHRWRALRELNTLGHVDLELSTNNIQVHIAPPVLAALPGLGAPRAVLCGARSPNFIEGLRTESQNAGVETVIESQLAASPYAPAHVELRTEDAARIKTVAVKTATATASTLDGTIQKRQSLDTNIALLETLIATGLTGWFLP